MLASCKAKGIPFDSYKKEALPSFEAGPHSSSLLELNSSPLFLKTPKSSLDLYLKPSPTFRPLPEAFTNLSTFT
ncbi:hypothetical protein AMTR_s00033p00001260 [Amborella trichopoda]|uniref:Uncharacterized protein n=1 Tax=Amborella trichopoda TaxID=13333 RepID=U5CYE9_AMBTC|nr:hypothetical protein AMTR_s00033p00001260 [Amborella trichopoda]